MNLVEKLAPGGAGVIATADRKGAINTAIYAAPHIVDEETLAWGMSEGRTYRNLVENPNAAYLQNPTGGGAGGLRITLRLKEIRDSGDLLEAIKARARKVSGPGAAEMVKFVGYFEVVEARPLM